MERNGIMSYILYKPNKSNTGSACQLNIKADESCLFIQISKQIEWKDGKGVFKGAQRLVSKCSIWEIGAILNCLEKNVDYSTVHQTKESQTQVKFGRYFKYDYEKKVYTTEQLGYSFSLGRKKGETTEWFKIGINFGEAEVLKSYLRWGLSTIYTEQYLHRNDEKPNKPEKAPEPQNSEPVEPPTDDGSL